MVYLFLSTYRNLLFYSYLVLELELFQSDTESVVFMYMAEQKLETILSNCCLGLYQTSPVSCHNIYTSLSKLDHNSH